MNISELIKELEKVKAEHGEDILVVVRYRDNGGDYHGFDSDLRLEYGEDRSEEDDYRDEVSVPKEKMVLLIGVWKEYPRSLFSNKESPDRIDLGFCLRRES